MFSTSFGFNSTLSCIVVLDSMELGLSSSSLGFDSSVNESVKLFGLSLLLDQAEQIIDKADTSISTTFTPVGLRLSTQMASYVWSE